MESGDLPQDSRSAWERQNPNALLLGLGCYDEDEDEEVSVLKASIEEAHEGVIASAEKGNKLEKKLELHLGGYKNRANMLRKKIGDASEALEQANNALVGFRRLRISEEAAIQRRLAALREEVSFVSTREREAQELYRKTKAELQELATNGVNGHY